MTLSMLIDGRAVDTDEHDPVINPALGEPFSTAPRATRAHVDVAMEAATRAFATWKTDEPARRAKLSECAAAIKARAQDLCPGDCAQNHPPNSMAAGLRPPRG
jgi:acyl-CoA reductase-like NAD-dependent aldehyde dehydrogenase